MGLIVIIYLSNVTSINEGPFEFIKGTHLISEALDDKYYWADNIQKNHKNDIVSCLGNAGTVIIADSRIIHRAAPHKGRHFRTSLFTQISSLEDDTYRERVLVNPSFVTNRVIKSKQLMNFLGFGLKNSGAIFPPTNFSHVPFNANILKIITGWMIHKIFQNSFELLPVFLKKMIRKKIGKELDYKSQARK